jgi:hypothetical protein
MNYLGSITSGYHELGGGKQLGELAGREPDHLATSRCGAIIIRHLGIRAALRAPAYDKGLMSFCKTLYIIMNVSASTYSTFACQVDDLIGITAASIAVAFVRAATPIGFMFIAICLDFCSINNHVRVVPTDFSLGIFAFSFSNAIDNLPGMQQLTLDAHDLCM